MIKKYSLFVLQKAINHALSLDESMPAKLQALDGKVLKLIITPLNVDFFILFKERTLELHPCYDGPPDTTIRSSPLGLIRLSVLPPSKVRSLFNDKVRMSGDVELGQRVKKLFDDIDIDWEGHLAQFTGDVVAHQMGSLVRRGRDLKHQMQTSMRHYVTEYLQEESRAFPSREEANDFFMDVDALSLDVERLEARVNQWLASL